MGDDHWRGVGTGRRTERNRTGFRNARGSGGFPRGMQHSCAGTGEDRRMQPRNMSMSGVVDLAAVKAAQEAKAKAEQARAEAARNGGAPAAPALVTEVT